MKKQIQRRLVTYLILYCNIMFLMPNCYSSGFQLFEGNSINVGDYGAGGAANLSDASATFFNPASLINLPCQQILIAGTGIFKEMEFTGNSSAIPISSSTPNALPSSGINTQKKVGDNNIIPAIFYGIPVDNNLVVGTGISVPFGLATEWPDDSPVRYAATKSEIITINFGPAFAYRLHSKFVIGGGLDIQYIKATLDSAVVKPSGLPGESFIGDNFSKNSAHGVGFGFNVGVLTKVIDPLTLSVHYRSRVAHSLTGKSTFDGPLAPNGAIKRDANVNVTMPDTLSISSAFKVTNRIKIMASAYYTRWNSIKSLVLNNIASPGGDITESVALNFNNTWKFAGGIEFKVNNKFLIRTGAGYDRTPTNDKDRSVRLPEGNRTALAIGGQYKLNKTFTFDFGYTHLFMEKGKINHTVKTASQVSTTVGNVHNHADLVSIQVAANIC